VVKQCYSTDEQCFDGETTLPVAVVEKKQEDQFFVGTVAVNNVFTAL
jgi:hypothetical protein